ncbi:MAG: FkbM family methyltransferase [Candidatus Pacebacteria bacterium]|nr:FkbM family methyltransferase [Candidatus Paceibacterota bacterium]
MKIYILKIYIKYRKFEKIFLWLLRDITIKAYGIKVKTHITDMSDAQTFREIFLKGEYDKYLGEPKKILDLGSNVGYSIQFFKAKYPKAIIYGYEPNPETFKKLKRNVKDLDNVFIYNKAISDKEGIEKMYLGNSSASSSLVDRFEENFNFSQVSCIELPIEKFDLIKFDIEGYEHKVIQNPMNTKYIIGEVHHDLGKGIKLDNFDLEIEKISKYREKVWGKIK